MLKSQILSLMSFFLFAFSFRGGLIVQLHITKEEQAQKTAVKYNVISWLGGIIFLFIRK